MSVGGRAWTTPETVDDSASADTAQRLRHLDVAHLLPGHGRPVHGEGVTACARGPDEGPKGGGVLGRPGPVPDGPGPAPTIDVGRRPQSTK